VAVVIAFGDWHVVNTLKPEALALGISEADVERIMDAAVDGRGAPEAYQKVSALIEQRRLATVAVVAPPPNDFKARIAAANAQAAVERAARPKDVAVAVPRLKSGVRSFGAACLRSLHPLYRDVWRALYDMAGRTPDRVVRTTAGKLAARATALSGRPMSTNTAGCAVAYLVKIGAVVETEKAHVAQRPDGRLHTEPGAVKVPLLDHLDARSIAAQIKANPVKSANRRKEAYRARRRGTSPLECSTDLSPGTPGSTPSPVS